MLVLVKSHGAINNDFLNRFATGSVCKEEFNRFAVEFYQFSRHFPLVLCSLLVNTANEEEAAELTKILTSELGDGFPARRHELLYRDFLRSIGIEPSVIMHQPVLATTRAWIDSQIDLYSGHDHFAGLGASFALENMAIPMWDKLIAGLAIYKSRWFSKMDMTYFTFHRALEESHEDAMESAVRAHDDDALQQQSFRQGAIHVLTCEQHFWEGLAVKFV